MQLRPSFHMQNLKWFLIIEESVYIYNHCYSSKLVFEGTECFNLNTSWDYRKRPVRTIENVRQEFDTLCYSQTRVANLLSYNQKFVFQDRVNLCNIKGNHALTSSNVQLITGKLRIVQNKNNETILQRTSAIWLFSVESFTSNSLTERPTV